MAKQGQVNVNCSKYHLNTFHCVKVLSVYYTMRDRLLLPPGDRNYEDKEGSTLVID